MTWQLGDIVFWLFFFVKLWNFYKLIRNEKEEKKKEKEQKEKKKKEKKRKSATGTCDDWEKKDK